MKMALLPLFVLVSVIPPALAYNELQDTDLRAANAVVTLDVEFGQDRIKELYSRNIFVPQMNSVGMTFYGDGIDMSDSYLRVYDDGRLFSIKNLKEGVAVYARYDKALDDYRINVYLTTGNGLERFTLYSQTTESEDVSDEPDEPDEPERSVSEQYVPELRVISSHDFHTYWRDTFDISVLVFDGNLNPDPKPSDFYGRLGGADVLVSLSKDDTPVADLSGVTGDKGEWRGGYLFRENISEAGMYTVDVRVSHLGETISESSSMFVIGSVQTNNNANRPPIPDAGDDQTLPEHDSGTPSARTMVTLDGSNSSDPDGDIITYLWVKRSGPDVTLDDVTSETLKFMAPDISGDEILIFDLTVTDSRGLESLTSDSVMITIEFVD